MLEDDLVDRYSRQILLPEVGGRGQERLTATHVTVTGSGGAAAFAATLLAAAGIRVECRPDDGGTLAVDVTEGVVLARAAGEGGTVVTLLGHPCARCLPDDAWLAPVTSPGTDDPQAIGALAAAEALRVALGLATSGRVQRLDPASGRFEGRPLLPTTGCDACGGPANASRI
jgi:hypothetical protein